MAGCALGGALGLIPTIAQTVSGAGALGASAVRGNDKQDQEGGDTGGPCDDLKTSAPLVIELKTAASGPLNFRLLSLVTPKKKTPYWEPRSEWQPGNKLAQIEFNPPLANVLPRGPGSYIVYAPSESSDQHEQNELESLMAAFGGDLGTFRSDGRLYDYTIVPRLPCFPAPR